MIENPAVGQSVVYLLGNGCLNSAVIEEIEDDLLFMNAQGSRACRMASEVFDADDHDGVVEALNNLISSASTTIELTLDKKKAHKPIFS